MKPKTSRALPNACVRRSKFKEGNWSGTFDEKIPFKRSAPGDPSGRDVNGFDIENQRGNAREKFLLHSLLGQLARVYRVRTHVYSGYYREQRGIDRCRRWLSKQVTTAQCRTDEKTIDRYRKWRIRRNWRKKWRISNRESVRSSLMTHSFNRIKRALLL